MRKRQLYIDIFEHCFTDAREWGRDWGSHIVQDRYYTHCMLVTTFIILMNPECFKHVLRTAYRIVTDPRFRRLHNYTCTRVTLARHERKFLQDYCTRHRIPVNIALTAGYILLKNIVYRGYTPEEIPEEIIYALRELKCIEAMELFLKHLPDSIYQKYFIDYVPGLKRCFPGTMCYEEEARGDESWSRRG